ncbi:hypothetical protein LUZ60_015456 [Juncus effusus]|nr:hypothetical protein LUZ60_015456 [Juncus effusus]
MESMHIILIWVSLILIVFPLHSSAQSPARQLDSLLQDYAYRAFTNPHTGIPYTGTVPANLTGIQIAALRLRSGSLRKRGFPNYMQFQIPVGILVQPYVERLVLVYQNLGNFTSVYYPLAGFTYLTPVIALLAYDAANLSATNLSELEFVASESPILIDFANLSLDSNKIDSVDAKCIWFDLNGIPQFTDLVSNNKCETFRRGHFAIAINSSNISPSQAPIGPTSHKKKKKISTKTWGIIGGVIGGLLVLIVLASIICCCLRFKRSKKVKEMERRADLGESLQFQQVGGAQTPIATGTRTRPVLENEYSLIGPN